MPSAWAGASVGAGLPDLAGLTSKVLATLGADERKLLEALLTGRNLEQALTRLRRIESLVESGEKVSGLDKTNAAQLDVNICQAIISAIRTPTKLDAFHRLGSWAGRADYRGPVEIFTANYDLLVETGLEHVGASYFDGFVGHLNGFFRHDMVEGGDEAATAHLPAAFVRLWKLHGSSNSRAQRRSGRRLPVGRKIRRLATGAIRGPHGSLPTGAGRTRDALACDWLLVR